MDGRSGSDDDLCYESDEMPELLDSDDGGGEADRNSRYCLPARFRKKETAPDSGEEERYDSGSADESGPRSGDCGSVAMFVRLSQWQMSLWKL